MCARSRTFYLLKSNANSKCSNVLSTKTSLSPLALIGCRLLRHFRPSLCHRSANNKQPEKGARWASLALISQCFGFFCFLFKFLCVMSYLFGWIFTRESMWLEREVGLPGCPVWCGGRSIVLFCHWDKWKLVLLIVKRTHDVLAKMGLSHTCSLY